MLWGCQTDDPVVGPQPQPALNSTEVAYRNQQTYDDRMAELADELPGFGGLYLDENQRLVIALTNQGDLRLARTKVREYFMARARADASRMAVRQQQIEEAISRSVKYDFRQLHTWYGEIRAKIFSLDGVTSGDIDEDQNRIVIGVADPEIMARVQKELAQVAAPEDAVLVKSGIRPAKLDIDLRDEVRPVVAGVQISTVGFCTLGYNVAHPEDSYWYFVTAAHCTNVFGVVDGDVFGQPQNNRPIGFEVADPPTFTQAEDPRCPSYECRFFRCRPDSLHDFKPSTRSHCLAERWKPRFHNHEGD